MSNTKDDWGFYIDIESSQILGPEDTVLFQYPQIISPPTSKSFINIFKAPLKNQNQKQNQKQNQNQNQKQNQNPTQKIIPFIAPIPSLKKHAHQKQAHQKQIQAQAQQAQYEYIQSQIQLICLKVIIVASLSIFTFMY